MRKYIISAVLCILAFFRIAPAFANTCFDLAASDGFSLESAMPAQSSGIKEENGSILWFDTASAEGKVTVKTPVFKYDTAEGLLSIRIEFSLSSVDSALCEKMTLFENNTLKLCELLSISGSQVSVFGGINIGSPLAENTVYTAEFAVNTATKEAWVWIDGQMLYNDNLGTKWKKFNYSKLVLQLDSYTLTKNESKKSDFYIKNIFVTGSGADVISVPADGAKLLKPTELSELKITFGGLVTDATYSGIVLKADGEAIGYTAERYGESVIIKPNGGFLYDTEYTAVIPSVKDLSDTELSGERTITFSTRPEAYVEPKIEFKGDEVIYEGQPAVYTVTTNSPSVEKIELFADEGLLKTEYGTRNEYVFEVNLPPGTYTIGTQMFTADGAKSEKKEIILKVNANTSPEIEIDLKGGEKYEASSLNAVEYSITDDIGVESFEITIDNNSYDVEASLAGTLDLSSLSGGRHIIRATATDIAGVKAFREIIITVAEGVEEITGFENNFDAYESFGGVIPEKMNGAANGDGKFSSYYYDETHNTVLRLSTDGKQVGGTAATGTWLKIPTGGTSNYFEAEFDILFEEKVDSYNIMFKDASSSNLTQDFSFGAENITIRTGAGKKTFDYNAGQWYRMKFAVDLVSKKWSIYKDGEPLIENEAITNGNIISGDLRLIMNVGENTKSACLIDNVSVMYKEKETCILFVGCDGDKDAALISPDSKTISIYLNNGLDATTVSKKSAMIDGVSVKEISYISKDKCLVLALDQPLMSETAYTVTLAETLLLPEGKSIGSNVSTGFNTGLREIDVSSVSCKKTGSSAYISYMTVNSGASDSIYTIISVYDGSKLISASVEEVDAKEGKNSHTTNALSVKAGQTVMFSVWNSLAEQKSVVNKIYKF